MLKGIDTRIGSDVLHALHRMGHGDMLVLVDTNFPADSVGRATATGRALEMANLPAADCVDALLTHLPLDTFVEDFAARMEVVGAPGEIPEVQREVQDTIDRVEGRARPMVGVERFAFYEMAKAAHTLIRTGERRFYGCFMLRKGVIAPDAR
jgi:L-fucose mutarotase